MRVTIIGQAPGKKKTGMRAFEGTCGDRLARVAGLDGHEELHRKASVINLLDRWPGKAGKGDAFPMRKAKKAAKNLELDGVVLFAGKGVAQAFGHVGLYFEWGTIGPAKIATIPHPSGVNRWWNDPANVARASEFLRGLFP